MIEGVGEAITDASPAAFIKTTATSQARASAA
ncbi:hypothetical protein N802_00305 [Knoellia sinensis KCTC 19936]|uniref:Uncharacterized protein n=1 Tax=Knoellia sinensis KCTC 19936 TaxID=1385520 RepID=A0A0A0JH84_9MICO|nr:hypothetical protein N802_00305 [Knoellia sinensis KCTC 19936]